MGIVMHILTVIQYQFDMYGILCNTGSTCDYKYIISDTYINDILCNTDVHGSYILLATIAPLFDEFNKELRLNISKKIIWSIWLMSNNGVYGTWTLTLIRYQLTCKGYRVILKYIYNYN